MHNIHCSRSESGLVWSGVVSSGFVWSDENVPFMPALKKDTATKKSTATKLTPQLRYIN